MQGFNPLLVRNRRQRRTRVGWNNYISLLFLKHIEFTDLFIHLIFKIMDINEFIKVFADQFDETELEEFKPETNYREDLDEWSSLNGLAILNMIDKKYGVKITASEIKETTTIEDVFNMVKSKM